MFHTNGSCFLGGWNSELDLVFMLSLRGRMRSLFGARWLNSWGYCSFSPQGAPALVSPYESWPATREGASQFHG